MKKQTEKPKILIVDDERTILLSLGHLLKADQVDVITCNRQDFAKTAIDNHFFALVILDLRLSGSDERDGIELLQYIRTKSPNTKVIVMTAYGSDEILDKTFHRGAFTYLEKPVLLEDVFQTLDSVGIPRKTAT